MTYHKLVPGKGIVEFVQEPVVPPSDAEPKAEEDTYQEQREAAQMEKIAASATRAMGRQPTTLPGLRRHRTILGMVGASKTDSHYDVLKR